LLDLKKKPDGGVEYGHLGKFFDWHACGISSGKFYLGSIILCTFRIPSMTLRQKGTENKKDVAEVHGTHNHAMPSVRNNPQMPA
jgi:hypothetical protein